MREREFLTILGPSGCGKSTLFKVLLHLEDYQSGKIERNYQTAGYLPQDGLLFPWKTLTENVELPMVLRGMDKETRRQRIYQNLETFGLKGFENVYPKELSGGMKQRAALLRTIVTDAPILYLDEPFGALDAITRSHLQKWLANLVSNIDRTILFITHDIEEAIFLSERIILLTDRPARILDDIKINIDKSDQTNRVSNAFHQLKSKLLKMIEEGTNHAQNGTI